MLPDTMSCAGNEERLALFIWKHDIYAFVVGANLLRSLLSVSQE